MAKEKTNNTLYTSLQTSEVETGFMSIRQPDKFSGKYTVDLMIKGNDTLLEQLNSIHAQNTHHLQQSGVKNISGSFLINEQSKNTAGNVPKYPDQYTGKGYFMLKTKSKNSFPIFDADGDFIGNSDTTSISVGSTVIADLTLASYEMGGKGGTTVYINGLQIISQPAATKPTVSFSPKGSGSGKHIQL